MANASARDLSHCETEVKKLRLQISHASSRDEALQIAMAAVELSMKALEVAKDSNIQKTMKAQVHSLMDEAERIKNSDGWRPKQLPQEPRYSEDPDVEVSTIIRLKEPVSERKLTTAENILLLKASKLNGFKFPPWKASPQESDFELKAGEELFSDGPELRLSSMQLEVFDNWKRPTDALPPPAWFINENDRGDIGPTMVTDKNIDLVQDAATDCSVVASLCAGVARGERGHATILSQVMWPYDPRTRRPRISQNGRYIVRLNFNGTYRRVDIDDRLPVSKTSRVLHVVDRRTPGLLWPALLEKAYLKVRGSYDFPGSNSGTDLWIISGWIPEQIFLQSDDTIPNQVWKRVYNAHRYGDVLVTMGTGKISLRTEKETGLAGEHDYAVLDLREVDGQKLLLVKNPWCEGTSWTGSMPRISRIAGSKSPVVEGDETNDEDDAVQSSRDLLNANDRLSPGTFWMDLDSVVQHFESIYLNWNPGLFQHRQDLHFSWDLAPQDKSFAVRGKFRSFAGHPQFRVTSKGGGSVWILLCRHFRDDAPDLGGSQTNGHTQDTHLSGYISLYAYENDGARVFLSDNALQRGPFVDSPQTLLKIDHAEPGTAYTVVPVEQDLPATTHTFTISVFATYPLSIEDAPSRYPHCKVITGSWTQDTAGGNAHSPNYSQNPQFSIELKDRASLALLLETAAEHINVHVKLVLGRGQRVESVRSRDIVFDSKDYRRGCALAEFRDLDKGIYTIICSTFEAGQTGDFVLRVDSTTTSNVRLLPREGAGRVRTRLSEAAFHDQQYKVAAPLFPRRLSRMRILAKHSNVSSVMSKTQMQRQQRSMIRVTLEMGRGPERQILIASSNGEFSDSIAGVRTDEIDLSPKMVNDSHMWLVIERMFTPRELPEETVQVEMFTETPDALGVGVWRKWDD